jgi:predicted DsbA family dithiol-disulfide isomerase
VLGSDELADEVWADIEQAQRFGATGVPFFVIDEKYGVSGAQPAETFSQVLERAWSERTPVVQMVGGTADEGDVCGPDGCAVPQP